MKHNFFVFCLFFFALNAKAQSVKDGYAVTLRGLDKITAKTFEVNVDVGSSVQIGSLLVQVECCKTYFQGSKFEEAVFLKISENNSKKKLIFSGWMLKSYPEVSALEHAIFDLWLKKCFVKN